MFLTRESRLACLPIGILLATLLASCGSNASLACPQSLQQVCPSGACDLTWAAVLADTALCSGPNAAQYQIADCGGYHVLYYSTGADGPQDRFYYDASTGNLQAETSSFAVGGNDQLQCTGGPSGGFTPPNCSAPQSALCGGGAPGDSGVQDGSTDVHP